MKPRNLSTYIDGQSYLVTKNEITIEISQTFLDMTEYSEEELLNKSIKELFEILKIGPDIDIENIGEGKDYFLFTKSLDARFISIDVIKEEFEKIYIFSEKQNSRMNVKFPAVEALCSQGIMCVALFSAPDGTLLKANQTYLNFLDKPFNDMKNSIGKRIHEIITGWAGSSSEDIWRNVLSTQKTFYSDEYMFESERGVNYWQVTLTPVFENGILKYCLDIATDITEKVLNRRKLEEQAKTIEQQKRELEIVLDNMSDGFSIIDKDGNYINTNKTIKQWLKDANSNKIGDTLRTFKYFDMQGNEISKEDLPTARVAKGERIEQYEFLMKADRYEKYFSVSGTPVYDENGSFVKGVVNTRDITEIVSNRKKLREQMKEIKLKNKQMEAIFESIQDSISIFDKRGTYLLKGSTYKKLFEPTDNDVWTVTEKTDFYNLDGSHFSKEELCHSKLMRGEKVKNLKMKLVADGREKYLDVSGAPIFDENGDFDMGIMFSVDITNVINLSNQVKKQKDELEAIIENVSDGLILFNVDGRIEFLNEEAKKFVYNYGQYKKVGDSYNDTEYFDMNRNPISLSDLPGVRAMRGEKVNNYLFKVKRPDKIVYYNASGSPIYDSEGNVVSGLLCARDITELVNNEKKILEQKRMNEIIIENAYENLYVLDSNGKFLISRNNIIKEISTSFEDIEELCKALKYYNMDGNEIPLNRMPPYRVLNKETVQNEIMHLKGDGFEYYIIVNGVPIYDEKGNLLYGIITGRNITELMKSQQDLKETQKRLLDLEREKNEALENAMEMKDDFLSVISHEFRTPLNVINTAIQTLNLVYPDQLTDKVKTYIGTIRQNTNRQLRLVNNLLDITRSNAGRIKINKKNVDIVFLTKAITESVYEYASRRGVRVTFVPKLTKKIIGVDDEKYERIILNLLSNAIKFTPEGKSIVVSLRTVKSSVCIEVMDKGIGIPQDKIDVIFEKFGQVDSSLSRQAEGTGIGLSLVKKFVEALDGSVTVKSKIGNGTTFKILLPDKTVIEEYNEKPMIDLMNDNRLIQNTNIEFSDIYL
ncbi:PAS domain-containing sensor histidine kinase [Clostridium beijerinckii]|nr:PAS domain-containing sensor histidine kinase [Clostridium beijerinckii]NRY59587.1 PAS domain S-box-containing protein [Clostridium beijerinckii]